MTTKTKFVVATPNTIESENKSYLSLNNSRPFEMSRLTTSTDLNEAWKFNSRKDFEEALEIYFPYSTQHVKLNFAEVTITTEFKQV